MELIRLNGPEAAALRQERDPELYFEGLLVLGGRRRQRGDFASAAAIYQSVAACPFPALAERGRRQLAALSGQGSVGAQVEFLVSQFGQQATDYRTIVPMIAGSSLFHLTRAATLGRLAGSGVWFGRGLAARATANLAGFAAEVPAFSLLSRGLMDLSGESVSWSSREVSRDLAGAALTLGTLKGFGYLGQQAAARIPILPNFHRAVLPQAAAFNGLLLAHHVEAEMGLRPKTDAGTAVAETLAALVSLSAGAHLGRRVLGPNFARWEGALRGRAQGASVISPRWAEPRWAFAFPSESPGRTRPLMMSSSEDSKSGEPFYIPLGRVRGNAEVREAPSEPTDMPFRTLVHLNSLYGGRVLPLTFEKPEKVYTMGVKNLVGRQYKNLHESASGKPDMTLVNQRDGSLHHRQRVQNLSERSPDFLDLIRNEEIRDQQAALELRQGRPFLRNLTREPLVWTLEGSKWRAVDLKGASLQEGSWIVLGRDPTKLPENTLDPKRHSVLRVELHRPWAQGPERWSLIQFEHRDPAALEKIATPKEYLAALLGQSPEFAEWRFRPLLDAAKAGDWKLPELKELVYRVYSDAPYLAELNLGLLAEALHAAQRSGWSQEAFRDLVFHDSMIRKSGMGFLSRLPKVLESGAAAQLSPLELAELLTRMGRHEKNFFRSLDALPDFLQGWPSSDGGKTAWPKLLGFLDRSQISIEVLRDLFPKIPGGEEAFLDAMQRIFPEIENRLGYRGGTTAELGAEILQRVAEHSPTAPAKEWVNGVLSNLPQALDKLHRLGFGYPEQRQILLRVAQEQGPNFSRWWEAAELERAFFEGYLKETSGLPIPGLLGLGLGLLGLHQLDPEVLRAASPAFLLGASIFFPEGTAAKKMKFGFALSQRFKLWFQSGGEKVEGLRHLARLMESQGFLREAHERYEAAVDLAEKHLASLKPRGPDNRVEAGPAHRSLGQAYFFLAGFWDRRGDRPSLALENYQMALKYLESLNIRRGNDHAVIERSQTRLWALHQAEAEHWERQGQLYRAGENYEAAAEVANTYSAGLELLQKAARSYARAEPPRFTDFARVNQKLHQLRSLKPNLR